MEIKILRSKAINIYSEVCTFGEAIVRCGSINTADIEELKEVSKRVGGKPVLKMLTVKSGERSLKCFHVTIE